LATETQGTIQPAVSASRNALDLGERLARRAMAVLIRLFQSIIFRGTPFAGVADIGRLNVSLT
jgi:hypothetical protein